jgi:uncharacterized glyoxalase superfamily protein PhnB
MTALAKPTRATVVPAVRYRDAQQAIEFLCRAFGFEKHLVVAGEAGTIAHAQLRFGNGMIMLGSASDDAYGRLVRPPAPGQAASQGIYVVVTDADRHCAQALAAGAEILRALTDQDYGGRDYTCRDPEGHVWTFGTYDPWTD